ncbi:MAG: DNA polymerase III subunit alpha [Patescibacteria group bacterium]|jgi:DNA polymerase-3 subunit alpha
MSSKFVHLHVHSSYSLLKALPQPDALAKRAKELGMTACAITDNGALYGIIEFYKACKKAEIKPIIGFEAYLAANKISDRRPRIDDRPFQIVLLAENLDGYKNLLKLTSIAHLDGFYYKPRVDKDLLRQYGKGIICLSGGLKGDVCKALEALDWDKAVALVKEYREIFGPDNFFLELQDHPELDEQRARNADLVRLSKETGAPLVATKDVHYLTPDDAEAHDVLVCIGAGKTVHQDDRDRSTGVDYSFTSGEQMEKAFADIPEAVENTAKIAERCTVEIEIGKWKFPAYPIPEGQTFDTVLRERAYAGIATKIPEITDDIRQRMDYELEVIAKKGYAVYFLVVSDYVHWSREQGIVSTTRGSAAGSLVSYAIDIVPVNPLYFKLPFERFLNPFRPSAPDIDVDFADDRRDEVIAYVTQKYGSDRVAQIGTFGTMAARAAVRDVGRALGLQLSLVDRVAKLIPFGSQGFTMTIDRAVKETPELKDLIDTDPSVAQTIELARKVEGCARHVSVHAAGVVIAPAPLTDYVPLQREPGGDKIITQFEMNAVGEDGVGVLKMDFLGIRNLSILGQAIQTIKRTKGVDIDLHKLPFDDKKAFELMARGETTGLFQLGGSGMTRYLKELKPTTIFDIMAMVALFRPGPMESIPEYIRRKHDPTLIQYFEPRAESYMKESLGLLVYQDDVMLTAIHLAGYDWMEADKFRKAMGKKIPEEMAKQEVKFREGCKKNSVAPKTIDQIWELIKPFAAYGFNKAHAASYAVVAYHTAYLKANYPAEFMTAVLSAESASGDMETVTSAVTECGRMGIEVLPPDVNHSGNDFTYIDDQHIRFGLSAIKNLGTDMIEAVIAERARSGQVFKDIADFAARVGTKSFNKKSLEALIRSGALDSLGERNQLLANIETILTYHKAAVKDADSGQFNLFAAGAVAAERAPMTLREVPPATKREKLAWERELLGLYVSEHPFREDAEYFGDLLTKVSEMEAKRGQSGPIFIGGVIFTEKHILTKKNEPMVFAQVGDVTGSVEVVVFPSIFKKNPEMWVQDAAVIIQGKYSEKDNEPKLLCDAAYVITPETAENLKHMLTMAVSSGSGTFGSARRAGSEQERILVEVPESMRPSFANELKRVLAEHPGNRRVVLVTRSAQGAKRIETSFNVEFSGDTIKDIEAVVGKGAVQAE